jgi:hypothetical protein
MTNSLTSPQVCSTMITKGKFNSILCQFCRHSSLKCEARQVWDNSKFEQTTARFDERREMKDAEVSMHASE